MKKPFFSVITPVYIYSTERHYQLIRAIHSVAMQTVDWGIIEHIVQDEGSPVEFETLPWLQENYNWLSYEKTSDHVERLNNYHNAMERARGEWFVFLDSDDALVPYALEALQKTIEANPEYKLFNFGSIHYHKNYQIAFREAFKPARLEVGHEVFGGGKIVNGTFIFHRSVYEELGGLPHGIIEVDDEERLASFYRKGPLAMTSPFDFSAYAQYEFPEIQPYFQVDVDEKESSGKVIKELGNPVGNDFYLFFKYTRKFWSEPLDLYLYQVFLK